MFDYPLLEVLTAIERERNFERAAVRLGVSKSYVSQRLRLLEERMGYTVICRNTILTTHLGKMLCRHLENVSLLEHEFLSQNKHYFNIEPPGPTTIKVSVGDDSLASWFKSIVGGLSSKKNWYYLDVETKDPATTLDDMTVGRTHCALSISDQPVPGFECHRLGTHSYRATASPAFAKKYFANGVTAHSLSEAPAMHGNGNQSRMSLWLKMALGQDVTPRANEMPSAHGILNACLKGDVWAMNSSLLVDEYLANGEQIELLPGVSLQDDLYWHINTYIADTLSDLTLAIGNASQSLGSFRHVGMSPPSLSGHALIDLKEPVGE